MWFIFIIDSTVTSTVTSLTDGMCIERPSTGWYLLHSPPPLGSLSGLRMLQRVHAPEAAHQMGGGGACPSDGGGERCLPIRWGGERCLPIRWGGGGEVPAQQMGGGGEVPAQSTTTSPTLPQAKHRPCHGRLPRQGAVNPQTLKTSET
jgi:hypothetical protein